MPLTHPAVSNNRITKFAFALASIVENSGTSENGNDYVGLRLRGRAVKADGTCVDCSIGYDFGTAFLTPSLAQAEKAHFASLPLLEQGADKAKDFGTESGAVVLHDIEVSLREWVPEGETEPVVTADIVNLFAKNALDDLLL